MKFKCWITLIFILFLIKFVESRRKGSSRGDVNNKPGMGGPLGGNNLDDEDDEDETVKITDAEEKADERDEIGRNEVAADYGRATTVTKAPTTTAAAAEKDEIGEA